MRAETLVDLLKSAERLSGAHVCICAEPGLFRGVIPTEYCLHYHPWCRFAIERARVRCEALDRVKVVEKARDDARAGRREPYIKRCHAGVCEAVAPVVSNGVLVAVVFLGQCRTESGPVPDELAGPLVRSGCSPTEVASAYERLGVTTERRLLDAAALLASALDGVFGREEYSLPGGVLTYVDAARNYINSHAHASQSMLRSAAQRLGVSTEYLGRIFKHATGLTVGEYASRVRLERARLLLINTDDSIEAVASASGFSDPSYFARAFKRTYGITPGEYRRYEGDGDTRLF